MRNHLRRQTRARAVRAVIVVTALNFELQTAPASSYDGRLMDSRLDTTFDLVARVKAGDRQALDLAIGSEAVERYDAALARLRPEEREAIVARVEMDCSYQEVAEALGKPSADAARMAVSRALLRLAEEMNRGDA